MQRNEISVSDRFIKEHATDIELILENPDRACKDISNPNTFFPERESKLQSQEAIAICATCPTAIAAGCLAIALSQREPFGIWGGMRTPDRLRLLEQ